MTISREEITVKAVAIEPPELASTMERAVRLYLKIVIACCPHLDLDRIEEVLIAADYLEVLRSIDRGKDGLAPLQRTEDEIAQGVAMVVRVMRDDLPKAVMVLDGNMIWAMLQNENVDTETQINAELLYLLAHECAHVHDLKTMDVAFPGRILRQSFASRYDAIRGECADLYLEEYIACRLSAPAAHSMVEEDLRTIFQTACKRAEPAGIQQIKAYRLHGDHNRILDELLVTYIPVIKYAGYLLGQIHGVGRTISSSPELLSFLEESWFRGHMYSLETALERVYDDYGRWSSIDDLDDLREIVEDVLAAGGMEIYEDGEGGMRVVLPYTLESMPDEETASTVDQRGPDLKEA